MRIYNEPQGTIQRKDGTFDITGCSGFLIENLGENALNCGPKGGEVIPITPGESREFETPDGGTYKGIYSILFTGGIGQALIIRNIGRDEVEQVRNNNRIIERRPERTRVETII